MCTFSNNIKEYPGILASKLVEYKAIIFRMIYVCVYCIFSDQFGKYMGTENQHPEQENRGGI
jgi:hypothetical protein